MKASDSRFGLYWRICRWPLLVLIAWNLASLFVALYSYSLYKGVFSRIAGLVLALAVYLFIGWTAVKDHKAGVRDGAKSGGLAGAIAGFVGAIIGIVMVRLVPAVVEDAVAAAVSQGAAVPQVRNFIMVSVYLGLVIGPLLNALIGALLSAVGALLATKLK